MFDFLSAQILASILCMCTFLFSADAAFTAGAKIPRVAGDWSSLGGSSLSTT